MTYISPLNEAQEATSIAALPEQVQWLIQDIAARYEAIIADKDDEIEGLEEKISDSEAELDSTYSDLDAERDNNTDTLDNIRECFDALVHHSGLDADNPELLVLGAALGE